MLLQGFNPDPSSGPYLPRRRLAASLISAWVGAGLVAGVIHLENNRPHEEKLQEVEIQDIPQEPEPEEPPEEEPPEEEPPEPEPEEPEPEIQERPEEPPPVQQEGPPPPDVPDEMPTEAPSESDQAGAKTGPGNFDERAKAAREGRSGTGTGGGKPAAAKPKPKPRPKKAKLDPTKAVELSKARGDTWPRQTRANKRPPYPEILRKKGITADVRMRLKVSHSGKLGHVKILKVTIFGTKDPAEKAKAKQFFLKSLSKVMKSWRFKPAIVNGQAQTVWLTLNIPFRLGG